MANKNTSYKGLCSEFIQARATTIDPFSTDIVFCQRGFAEICTVFADTYCFFPDIYTVAGILLTSTPLRNRLGGTMGIPLATRWISHGCLQARSPGVNTIPDDGCGRGAYTHPAQSCSHQMREIVQTQTF